MASAGDHPEGEQPAGGALRTPPSPEDFDAVADDRDRLADARDGAAAARRGDDSAAEWDRGGARDDRERSAEDRQRSAADRERAASDVEHLREALVSRGVIGQAQGRLMQLLEISADDAFDVLVRCSQHRNEKLRDVAARVARDGWPLQP